MGLLQFSGKESARWATDHRVTRIRHNLAIKPPPQTFNSFDFRNLLLIVIVSL